ncbi:triple tyrosine motif-containing protein [Winogradskyella luteola]|uniref:LuxR family transcriptional regulator n=1 Tax=Winogradskyella luteola TaxID=2828330 RepID=A0A9X1F8R6_9FLAO|nr:triple tyrosine motif-containing protein [Winogradskyella luteola]MBV7269401.1 LuxR family transcriptional regulator [Winogradskyella luteola]
MRLIRKILRFSLCLIALNIQSQEVPPIQVFTPQDYNAEDQNWSVSQSENDFIYVANNKGLLEYNGAYWQLYESPNNDILRSVHVVEGRIYSGGYMDFGFWTKNEYGGLFYKSLTKNKTFKIKEDEEFWGIIDIEGFILFQSLDRIYIYNALDESVRVIESESRINKMYKVNETIYFQKNGVGVFKIENGKEVFVTSYLSTDNIEIINIFDNQNTLLFLTKEDGFYEFQNNKVKKCNYAENDLSNVSLYSSTKLRDGSFMLGTISNGIIQLDNKGNTILKINKSSGLSNNTVLSIKEDADGNVWLGLDNGVNVINLNSPYKVYKDKQGTLGTIYASVKTNENLYLGTNQGLFYKTLDSQSSFKFVSGTEGQVWFLKILQGTLFCGHDKGTFIINKDRAQKISEEKGTWKIKEIEGKPNLLIQGNYRGLSILEKITNNEWQYRNKINGFDISSRYIEFSGVNEVLVSHEHKGVYKIEIDSTYTNVLNYKKIAVKQGVKSSIAKFNNSIYYSYKEGVYRYNEDKQWFEKDSLLSTFLSQEKYLSGKLINDKKGDRLWGFNNNEIIYIETGKLSNKPDVNTISIPSKLRSNKTGFEDLLNLGDGNYLFGTTDGYFIINLNKLQQNSDKIYLNEVSYGSFHSELVPIDLNKEDLELSNKNNSLKFKYSVTDYDKLSSSKYQYRLLGIYDEWSAWSTDSEVFFENLPYGSYSFEARAITGGVVTNNVLSYTFSIDKPWYLKPLAITLYVLSFLFLALITQYLNIRYYKKQKHKLIEKKGRELELKQLENQRQLMEFKNENLQLDIENKNRELGIATMNLVKRNEFLNTIKEELSRGKSLDDFKKVIKLINSNLNDTNDWKLFEEAFNNVDKDFMKKVKSLHPSITPNDLRLCAYLRLNLSSKEIAPLLNISHKSVEVKRYRLRKKMGLDHEQSLTNYILEI